MIRKFRYFNGSRWTEKWMALISVDNKKIVVGEYDTEEEAKIELEKALSTE